MNKHIRRDITSIKYVQKELNNLRNFKRNKYRNPTNRKNSPLSLFHAHPPTNTTPKRVRHRVNIIYIYTRG